MVFLKFRKFNLRFIGHFKSLSEECSRIKFFEARDDLLVHGLEKLREVREN